MRKARCIAAALLAAGILSAQSPPVVTQASQPDIQTLRAGAAAYGAVETII